MVAITQFRRSPWSLLDDLMEMQGDFNSLLGGRPRGWAADRYPPLNMTVTEDEVVAELELPGVDPKEVSISVTGHSLTVSGERKPEKDLKDYHLRERLMGRFERSVALPYRVDSGKVAATYRNGILVVKMARSEADKPRTITVEAA